MNDGEIEKLLEEIDGADFREFWRGSKLLERCQHVKDSCEECG